VPAPSRRVAPRIAVVGGRGGTLSEEAPVRDHAHLSTRSPPSSTRSATSSSRPDRDLITGLGEDVTREGLLKTPERVERSLRFLTSGYDADVGTVLNGALFASEGSEMVVVKGIEFYSLCEHHMLPFFGKAHIAYIPGDKILGCRSSPAWSTSSRAACRCRSA
jgi:hypothetical protein